MVQAIVAFVWADRGDIWVSKPLRVGLSQVGHKSSSRTPLRIRLGRVPINPAKARPLSPYSEHVRPAAQYVARGPRRFVLQQTAALLEGLIGEHQQSGQATTRPTASSYLTLKLNSGTIAPRFEELTRCA